MRDDQLQRLREDYPDLVGAETTMDVTMPEAWLTPIRDLLTRLREIKFARRVGVAGGDIAIRSIAARIQNHGVGRRTPASLVLDVRYHCRAPAKTMRAIRSDVRHAAWAAREAEMKALRAKHLLDIVHASQAYVRATISAGQPIAARDVVMTSAYDSDQARYEMANWVLLAVEQWSRRGALGDLTATEKSRFIGITKGQR